MKTALKTDAIASQFASQLATYKPIIVAMDHEINSEDKISLQVAQWVNSGLASAEAIALAGTSKWEDNEIIVIDNKAYAFKIRMCFPIVSKALSTNVSIGDDISKFYMGLDMKLILQESFEPFSSSSTADFHKTKAGRYKLIDGKKYYSRYKIATLDAEDIRLEGERTLGELATGKPANKLNLIGASLVEKARADAATSGIEI